MPDYEHMARDILFCGKLDMERHKVEYRKGKGRGDVLKAIAKAHKNGMQKTEHEISMLEVYLKAILKGK